MSWRDLVEYIASIGYSILAREYLNQLTACARGRILANQGRRRVDRNKLYNS